MGAFENYQGLIIILPIYAGIGLAAITPAPYGIVVFSICMGSPMVWLIFQPKLAKWIGNTFKHIWAFIESDYNWPGGRKQFFFNRDPAQLSKWLARSREWQTFISLDLSHPIQHPYYNGGRKVHGLYLRHGEYSFNGGGRKFTDKELQDLSSWDRLFPERGDFITFMQMWVYNKSSDSTWLQEVMPDSLQYREAQTAIQQGRTLLNHVPIVVDGTGYPVFRVMRATGSKDIEKALKRIEVQPQPQNGKSEIPGIIVVKGNSLVISKS